MPTEEMIEEEATEEEFSADEIEGGNDIELDAAAVESDADDDADSAEGDAAEEDGETEALDELEAEELDMLTDDETSETLVVDEAAEMRQIRREELAMDRKGADEATEGEFVCTSCFLVLKTSQLADGRRKICRDCAACTVQCALGFDVRTRALELVDVLEKVGIGLPSSSKAFRHKIQDA